MKQPESKYHLELPGGVERVAGVLPEKERSCRRRVSISDGETEGGLRDVEEVDSVAAAAEAGTCEEWLGRG